MIQVGDIVICINNKSLTGKDGCPPPLVVGEEYVISSIIKCKCGNVNFDVGLSSSRQTICQCGTAQPDSSIWWADSRRFVKADLLNSMLKEELQEVDEDYFLVKL